MTDDETRVSLYRYFNRLMEEHEKLQREQKEATDKALVIARTEADKQYHMLNNLRTERQEDRRLYLTVAEYSSKHEALSNEMSAIHKQLDRLDSRIAAWGAAIGVFAVILQILAHFIWGR